MPRYRLTERTLIGNDLVEPGEIEFEGLPTRIFVPLDKAGEEKRAEYEALEAKRQADNAISGGKEALNQIDPTLAIAIRQIVLEAMAERDGKAAKQIKPKPADLA